MIVIHLMHQNEQLYYHTTHRIQMIFIFIHYKKSSITNNNKNNCLTP